VQGGRYEDLRKESAKVIGSMDLASRGGGFEGFGVGGSFVKEDMATAVKWVNEILPEEKPRHLLGMIINNEGNTRLNLGRTQSCRQRPCELIIDV
jgi:tRNA-guanine family transglycosylase